MQSSGQEPNGLTKTYRDPNMRIFSMTTIAQRITAAATAFALSLVLIAGTVHTPAPTGAIAALQETI